MNLWKNGNVSQKNYHNMNKFPFPAYTIHEVPNGGNRGGYVMETNLFYEVIVGAFGIWYNATLVNNEARNRGLSTRIRQHKGKYCVSAGTFSDEETARENLRKVKNTGYIFAYIMHNKMS